VVLCLLSNPACCLQLLETLGRGLSDQPALLAEVAVLCKISEQRLAQLVVPHVLGLLCTQERLPELQVSVRQGWTPLLGQHDVLIVTSQ
jgi:hypothetical protein